MVRWLYRTDTPTNVLPSIHVFNSLAVHMSLTNCEALRDHKGVGMDHWFLTLLIIMSTMFLKQHSVIDVCCGATLALFGYLFFYPQKAGEEASGMAVERIGRNNRRNIIKKKRTSRNGKARFFLTKYERRQPNIDKICCKVGRTDCRNDFSNSLQSALIINQLNP